MEISIKNSTLLSLLKQHETPFYIYNEKVIINTVTELKKAFPISGFELLFATMANDNLEFLKIMNKQSVGACINSIKHLNLAVHIGFPADIIQYTSSGLSKADMMILVDKKVTVNLDSISQINQWFSLEGSRTGGTRINAGSLHPQNGQMNRLGIDKNELKQACTIAESFGKMINGIHVYLGTNFTEPEEMMPTLKEFFKLAETLPTLEYINIGGGIGIDYLEKGTAFNIQKYGKEVVSLLKILRKKLNREIKLFFEPGRRLAAPSGYFVTKITDIKFLNKQKYIVVDASIANFPRPLLNPETPHKTIAPFVDNVDLIISEIVGKTTFSKDILSIAPLPKSLIIGDVIVFNNSGAYCDSMRSIFLGQHEPANLFLNE